MTTAGELPVTNIRRFFRPRLLLIAIVALTALRPGDAPWVNDESILMEMAIRYNATASDIYGVPLPFTPCPFGLLGTRGARYGPLPVWIDQIFLSFTHNLIYILAGRAILFTAITAAALCWLSRTLRLNPWFAIITMLSPWLWVLSRQLWDSTICIPISAVLLAAYAAFLVHRTAWPLCLTLLCCILLPLVHLMGIAMVLPVAMHILFFHYRELLRSKWIAGAIVAVCAFLFRPYLVFFLNHSSATIPDHHSALLGWLFPLLGGHYLTLGVAGTIPADGWQHHAATFPLNLFLAAQWIGLLPILTVWLGMSLAIPRAWNALRHPSAASPIQHLCMISLAVWICQTFLDGILRLYFSPQYYAATWIVYVFFAWLAVDWLLRRLVGISPFIRSLIVIYAAGLVIAIVIIATSIARNAGAIGPYYGTSLSNQIEAVKKIQQFSNGTNVDIRVAQWLEHPLDLRVLMELNPPATVQRSARQIIVKSRDAYPGDARIEVSATE